MAGGSGEQVEAAAPAAEKQAKRCPSPSHSRQQRIVHMCGDNLHLVDSKSVHCKHRNRILTSKYTLVNFLPINLFEQFRRVANFFFIVVLGIQLIFKEVSPFPAWTSLLPLVFILGVSAVKEGVEDLTRHRSDRATNRRQYRMVLKDGSLADVACEDIKPGDILAIQKDQEFPADVLVLATSSAEGICFANTASLDGESAPKVKKAMSLTASMNESSTISKVEGRVECNFPDRKLDSFLGCCSIQQGDREELTAIDDENFVMRGSLLSNCELAYCCAIYTGLDTKIMLNQQRRVYKFSGFEKILNHCVLYAIGLMTIVVCGLASGAAIQSPTHHVLLRQSAGTAFGEHFLTFFVLFSFMIPMSLYVTMEFVKVGQAWMMHSDAKSRLDPQNHDSGILVNSSSMNEELGRIEYIFSDKTGTLTQNTMMLSSAVIDGVLLPNPFPAVDTIDVEDITDEEPVSHSMVNIFQQAMQLPDDGEAMNDAIKQKEGTARASVARRFFLNLLVCNSLLPVENEQGERELVSSSPDETALADFLEKIGARLQDRTRDALLVLNVNGVTWKYRVLAELAFSSDRRRMVVIVQNLTTNRIDMFVKGADSALVPMIRKEDAAVLAQTEQHLETCSGRGSRTLMMASKQISQREYDAFLPEFQNAQRAIGKRMQKIEACFAPLEKDLDLLGITAIQDPLQENVRGTIARLLDAGIQIMILTGDKQETAVHIAYDAGVLQRSFQITRISGDGDVSAELNQELEKIEARGKDISHALVIDGNVLERCVQLDDVTFMKLLARCKTVICSRSAPSQKSLVVKLVKKHWRKVCLAIGDGANDVSMIQEAHVGVGVRGAEGAQAAYNADYVISRFYQLRRLVLVHGRYNLVRSTSTVYSSFYKNIAFPTTQVWFAMQSQFSGQALYDAFVMTFFNLLFASLPPLSSGITEVDISDDTLMNHPKAYKDFVRHPIFTSFRFIGKMIVALLHGAILYYIAERIHSTDSVISVSGHASSLFVMGAQVSIAGIILVNMKMLFDLQSWNWIDIVASASGMVMFMIVFAVYAESISLSADLFGVIEHVLVPVNTFFYIVLVLACCILPDVFYRNFKKNFRPDYTNVLQGTNKVALRRYKTISKNTLSAIPSPSALSIPVNVELSSRSAMAASPAKATL